MRKTLDLAIYEIESFLLKLKKKGIQKGKFREEFHRFKDNANTVAYWGAVLVADDEAAPNPELIRRIQAELEVPLLEEEEEITGTFEELAENATISMEQFTTTLSQIITPDLSGELEEDEDED